MVPYICQNVILTISLITIVNGAYVPSFKLLQQYYPGYREQGGMFTDLQMLRKIGNIVPGRQYMNNTSALRLSFALNKIGDEHSLGNQPITFPSVGRISETGQDRFEYIASVVQFGPYLTAKYGNPVIFKPHRRDTARLLLRLRGRKGIVRLLTFFKDMPEGGHIALWNCDHFHQIKDYSHSHHLIAVEFWESEGSSCPGVPKHKIKHPSSSSLRRILSKLYHNRSNRGNHRGNYRRRHHFVSERYNFRELHLKKL